MSMGFIKDAYQKTLRTLATTHAEIYFMAGLTAATAGFFSHIHELQRAQSRPLAFSELSQMVYDAEKSGDKLSDDSYFYAASNDWYMKNAEAYNHSFASGIDQAESFQHELTNKWFGDGHKYSTPKLAEEVSRHIGPIIKRYKSFLGAQSTVESLEEVASESWYYHTIDHYHTETHTETVSDGDGKSHTETTTEEVYDNTTHYFDYHPQEGKLAVDLSHKVLLEVPMDVDPIKLTKAKMTNADGEDAAYRSRKSLGEDVKKLDYLMISGIWEKAAVTKSLIPQIINQRNNNLPAAMLRWQQYEPNAHSDSYTTSWRVDSGPDDYRAAKELQRTISSFSHDLAHLRKVVIDTPLALQRTTEMINDFVHAQKSDKNFHKLSEKILDNSSEIYSILFPEGVDTQTYRLTMVALWTLAGLATGAGIGATCDYLTDKYGTYGKLGLLKEASFEDGQLRFRHRARASDY